MQQSAKHAKRLEPSAEANAGGVSSRAAAKEVKMSGVSLPGVGLALRESILVAIAND